MDTVQEPLRDRIGRAIYEENNLSDWYSLSEARREPWRKDADRVLLALSREELIAAGKTLSKDEHRAFANTDRELWRERPGDFYSPSIHVTEHGGIGINVGGRVIVMSLKHWHNLAIIYEASHLRERSRAATRGHVRASQSQCSEQSNACEQDEGA